MTLFQFTLGAVVLWIFVMLLMSPPEPEQPKGDRYLWWSLVFIAGMGVVFAALWIVLLVK